MGDENMTDDELWKKRFFTMTFVRLIGTALGLIGMGIAFGDWIRPGGAPWLGLPLVVAGLLGLTVAPRLMSRRWRGK
jgi:protein-S-isoprenylcysteine O-methyltransferase Ste14